MPLRIFGVFDKTHPISYQ